MQLMNSLEAGIRIKTSSSVDDFTIHGAESAIVGSPVRLPCDVSISTPEDSITLILWYRGDRKSAPIYSVDARSGNLANAKHHSAESLKSRIKFELNPNLIKHNTAEITSSKSSSKASHHSTSSTSRAYLTLDPILMEDEGIYLCRVDFKWSRTMNTVTNLTVVCEYKFIFAPDVLIFLSQFLRCILGVLAFHPWIIFPFFRLFLRSWPLCFSLQNAILNP